MSQLPKQVAANASFQAFMNCYLREIDSGVWHSAPNWLLRTGLRFTGNEHYVLELQLTNSDISLAIGVSFRSIVGRHTLTHVYQQSANQLVWQSTDYLAVQILLVENIFRHNACENPQVATSDNQSNNSPQLELLSRMIESQQVMTRYLEGRHLDPRIHSSKFIDSEQSILFGHWLHPTPKSRQGIHDWQHQDYTPELGGKFQLHYFAIQRSLVQQDSNLSQSAEELIQQCLQLSTEEQKIVGHFDKEKYVLIPSHPLQAQWLLSQGYITALLKTESIIYIGPLGLQFTPTSSVRTLYCETLDYMFKLSIPVKITNSLRINMRHELDAGVVVANLLRKSQFSDQFPQFKSIDDPAYITVNLPGMDETGFELIIRENPFSHNKDGSQRKSVQSIAAIVQAPLTTDQPSRLANIIHSIAEKQHKPLKEVALTWFDRYWHCAIETAIYLYDYHGIALEAHQQNSLLDISEGYPCQYYYRDNQGFYLSTRYKNHLRHLDLGIDNTPELFYTDDMIIDRFSYYLIVNQLFSVINRLGIDNLVDENTLIDLSVQKLTCLQAEMTGSGRALIDSLLTRQELPCKGNLLTRVEDLDELQAELELAIYTKMINPLAANTNHTQNSQTKNIQETTTSSYPQNEAHLESA